MTARWHRRRGLAGLIAVIVAALAAPACTSTISGTAHSTEPVWVKAPDAHVKVDGTDNGQSDQIAENSISDIQMYWKTEMPKVFNEQYAPVSGGFYSIDPRNATSLPCQATRADISGNAFYCPKEDLVVWDRTTLLPQLATRYGDYTIALVLAHEWGHAIQKRAITRTERTIVRETQADCFAGAFTRWAYDGHAPHFKPNGKQLDESLAGFLNFADPLGVTQSTQGAHGNAFDRVTALQEGYDKGPAFCASSANFNDSRQFTELPFTTSNEQVSRGNLPIGDALTQGNGDLQKYWATVLTKDYHKTWTKPSKVDIYSGASGPSCDGSITDKTIAFCAGDNNKIVVQKTPGMQSIYNGSGDYGPMVLLATAYAMTARHELGRSTDDQNGLLGSVCLAGVYTARLFNNTKTNAKNQLQLSPGDLDEAIQALLLGVNDQAFDGPQGTTGFQRVNVFSQGVLNGFKPCNSY
ncbi:MAG: neutral zinc metallopeptidase [Mycobacteriales bacterium]